jgi:hypothetical protein
MSQALFGTDPATVAPCRRGSQHGSQRREKDPSPERVGACDLGALGGTRTPNLLIRSQMLYPLSYERWMPR